MFKNKTKIITVSIFLIFMVVFVLVNPFGSKYDRQLEKAVKSINSEQVHINEVIPFEWDAIYTFPAYTDKNTIENEIAIKSNKIKTNDINEGMVHLIFVKGDKVLTTVLGYPDNLGYDIVFDHKITYEENAVFNVSQKNDVVTLEMIK